ncbi:uncharacterized protein [Rutidosis leptorrhynchoides]|uniref:uncharacterized protein n=1 Tax=Rutidosis leptorrhynchoides TaxID=125765 RepID=UPI003A9A0A2F
MDISEFDIHNVKAEKANAMLRYRRFRTITKFFRCVEVSLALILISWMSTRLPFVIRISGEYFRLLVSVIVSPLFIFLISNVIVVTLLVKSGQITGNISDVRNSGTDMYEEIVNNVTEGIPPVIKPDEIVYQDKEIVLETNSCTKLMNDREFKVTKKPLANTVLDMDLKVYRRSQSENLMKRETEKVSGKLKRSETEVRRRKDDDTKAGDNAVDYLSNEEFQRKIEGFIAKQVRFHQEEKLAIVVPHNIM